MLSKNKFLYTNLGRLFVCVLVLFLSYRVDNLFSVFFASFCSLFSFVWLLIDNENLARKLDKFYIWIPSFYDVLTITILIYLTGNINSINVIFYMLILTISTAESNKDMYQPIAIFILSNFSYLILNLLIHFKLIDNISIFVDDYHEKIEFYNIFINQAFLLLCQSTLFSTVHRIKKENNKNYEIQVQLKMEAQEKLVELEITQEKLLKTEKMAELGQLVSSISHEINNPLSIIKANTEMMDYDITIILKQIPKFLESLTDIEKKLFNELIAEAKVSYSMFLSEERRKRKEIKEKLSKIIDPNKNNFDILVELSLKLNAEEKVEDFITLIGEEKTLNLFKIAEIFFNLNKYLERIKLSIDKTNKIIFALKNYSTLDRMEDKSKMNILSEIQRNLKLYENYINGRIIIRLDIPGNINYFCYKENMFQVINNIIYNAIQSLLNSNKKILDITVKITDDIKQFNPKMNSLKKDYIIISIRDNGNGIPDILQNKIFTPFFTTKTLGEGVGLGLFISKKIVKDHNGEIIFKSNEESTEFIVILPE
jgi:signal transduction histidine kinase